tara:strand:+ start:105047 stop:105412 length:366 start_codon:yes stop_codon:yes gene_type:complete
LKKFFIIACLVFGGLYYFTKDRDINDVHKAIGNPAVKDVKTKSEIKAEQEKINQYNVGDCFKVSPNSSFEVYKITKVDLEKKDYHYKLCIKFKGCQTDSEVELITNFEYDHRENSKVACFR